MYFVAWSEFLFRARWTGADHKALVVVAAEADAKGIGRIRMARPGFLGPGQTVAAGSSGGCAAIVMSDKDKNTASPSNPSGDLAVSRL
jgi:hypothetical protein